MDLTVRRLGAGTNGKITVSDSIFTSEYNEPLIHQVVTAFMAGGRSGTKAQKTRSDVRGGGKKPWKQKGTGRARAGTTRSPIWRSGGVTFAARPKCYTQKLNKKMYRGAMRSIFSELVRQDRLVVVDEFPATQIKTKDMVMQFKPWLTVSGSLIVVVEITEELFLSTRNIPNLDVVDIYEINPYLLLRYEKILIACDALEKIGSMLL